MKFNQLFIFLLYLITKKTIEIPCKEEDFKQIFSLCNPETNLRTISIILISDCENKKIENDNSLLSIYSTLPVFNISCDEYCNEGEIMKFNPFENKINCEKCPENTFSSGGDLKITNNWNKEILKKFNVNCFAISNENTKKDENCTKLIISHDKSMIMTGDLIGDFIKYYIQIIYFFNSKQSGRFLLKYKQDSIIENNFNNGEFKLYLDYELIKRDNKQNNDWKIVYKDFNEGEHQIVLSYWFIKGQEEKMKLYISNFEIINYEENSLICEKCINSISPEGSSKCYSCLENYFFNEQTQKCEKCKDNEFSFLNSNYCQIKEECNIYDKELIDIGKCINGIKILKYKVNDNFCILKDNFQLIEEVKCDINNDINDEYNNNENNKNVKCTPGKIFINEFTFDFTNYLLKDFFNIVDGFISNGNEIFSNIYLSEEEEILTKNFQIISPSAYLEIDIALDLEKDETFTIKTNSESKSYSNIKKNFTETIKLSIGKNTLNLINIKNPNSNKKKLNIIIKGLKIYGSDIENSKKTLIKCPHNLIASMDCKSCVSCLNNEIPDAHQISCIKCNEGISQIINGKYLCSKCPYFTHYENEECKLNDIIIIENEKLRFNLKPLKKYNQLLCNDQNGIFCYDNSFIVTTSNVINSIGNINQKDLFFISIFKQNFINIYDFQYEEDKNLYKKGQIFALFTISKPSFEINSDIFSEQNITFSNIKIKKNLGQFIKKIYFAEKSLSNSIIIEFEEGDSCLSDPSINYKTYINLKCNKYEISSPILNKVLNNKCTFIFDWNTPYACKNCLTQDLTHFERGVCKNGKREIVFSPNDYCLIFNFSNIDIKELNYEDYNEKKLDQDSDLYKNIFGNNRNLKIVNIIEDSNKFKFDFDYIENNVYIQKCSFIDNLDDSLKKFLIIIPMIYIITLIGVIFYCRKYRRILYEYEKINSDVKSEIGSRIETKSEKKENKIEVVE